MPSLLGGFAKATAEGFIDQGNAEYRRRAYMDLISVVLAHVFAVVIMSFVGKLLWNGVIVDLFSFAKPARSIWQIVGLMVFVSLLMPGY
jgi:ABC-type multidrug transport system fused ATPase/permease subunit